MMCKDGWGRHYLLKNSTLKNQEEVVSKDIAASKNNKLDNNKPLQGMAPTSWLLILLS